MKVLIDGIDYVPAKAPTPTDLGAYTKALNAVTSDGSTVREYLEALLLNLWSKGEGFSSKRPFGEFGWAYDLYYPLIDCGFIAGVNNGDWDCSFDVEEAHEKVLDLIRYVFARSN